MDSHASGAYVHQQDMVLLFSLLDKAGISTEVCAEALELAVSGYAMLRNLCVSGECSLSSTQYAILYGLVAFAEQLNSGVTYTSGDGFATSSSVVGGSEYSTEMAVAVGDGGTGEASALLGSSDIAQGDTVSSDISVVPSKEPISAELPYVGGDGFSASNVNANINAILPDASDVSVSGLVAVESVSEAMAFVPEGTESVVERLESGLTVEVSASEGTESVAEGLESVSEATASVSEVIASVSAEMEFGAEGMLPVSDVMVSEPEGTELTAVVMESGSDVQESGSDVQESVSGAIVSASEQPELEVGVTEVALKVADSGNASSVMECVAVEVSDEFSIAPVVSVANSVVDIIKEGDVCQDMVTSVENSNKLDLVAFQDDLLNTVPSEAFESVALWLGALADVYTGEPISALRRRFLRSFLSKAQQKDATAVIVFDAFSQMLLNALDEADLER